MGDTQPRFDSIAFPRLVYPAAPAPGIEAEGLAVVDLEKMILALLFSPPWGRGLSPDCDYVYYLVLVPPSPPVYRNHGVRRNFRTWSLKNKDLYQSIPE
jgi:hypothetical protein